MKGNALFIRMFKVLGCLLLPLCFVFTAPCTGYAQSSEQEMRERIERLEKVIQEQKRIMEAHDEELKLLKQELKQQSEKVDAQIKTAMKKPEHKELIRGIMADIRLTEKKETPEEKELRTVYDEGFYLKGRDDQLRIGGWLQFDSRWYLDSDHPKKDTFVNRRARFDVRGVLENDWGYRLYATFIGERNGILQEGWLEYRKYGSFRIRAGEVYEPFSMEAVYSARWLDLIERATIVNALSPQEDIGIMAFGKVWDNRFEYALGFFNGQGRNRDSTVSDKDFTTRIAYSPFLHASSLPFLKKLNVGASFSTGNNERDLSGSDLQTEAFTTFFDFQSGVSQDGRLSRGGGELEYLYGPFSLRTEYLYGHFEDIRQGDQFAELTLKGGYVNIGYVVTGEDAPRDNPIKPRCNFDPSTCKWGAFQLMGRYPLTDTDSELLDSGFALGTDQAQAVAFGVNWYPNRHLRLQFNYAYSWFDDEITLSNVVLDHENTFTTRFQYDF